MSDKSLLAKLLATENLQVQKTPGITTAMFDLKNRVLMLPIWEGISNDLEDLLLVHETGHALDTPEADKFLEDTKQLASRCYPKAAEITKQHIATVQGFINVIEDARIDKRQKRRYPGCRRNYLIGYNELVERDFFGTASRDINTFNFIDRLNMYCKGGNVTNKIKFDSEEKVLLKKVELAETWDEVLALSEEIFKFCKDRQEQQQQMQQDLMAEESENGEDGAFVVAIFDLEFDDDGDGESNVTEGEGKGGASNGSDGAPSMPGPISETDAMWQKKSQEIVKNESNIFVYMNPPDVNYDKAIDDYKKVLADWRKEASGVRSPDIDFYYRFDQEFFAHCRGEFTKWKMKEKESISFMVKEFEQRKAAELYARINIAKTGVIDTNKLHSYKYNDDIFRRLATIPKGKNHGFVMFLDWSVSMHYNLGATLMQLMSLTMFCKQIGVPFEVYAFKDTGPIESPFTYLERQNVVQGGRVVLRNFLSSRMNVEEMNFAMTMLYYLGQRRNLNSDSMGGTPLDDAIMIAPKIVNQFTTRNKLEITNVIWLTDGESNGAAGIVNESVPAVDRMTRRDRRYFFVDPITHKTYDYHPFGYSGRCNTAMWLRVLKDQTNCNLVGFYLYGMANFKRLDYDFKITHGDPETFTKARQFWDENKFYPVKTSGYDEYYVIDANSMKDDKNELEINKAPEGKKVNTKKLAAAFSKFAKKKTVNRVLLRQFVEKIATQSKKIA